MSKMIESEYYVFLFFVTNLVVFYVKGRMISK
jgi:hypothetical protein